VTPQVPKLAESLHHECDAQGTQVQAKLGHWRVLMWVQQRAVRQVPA